METDKKQKNLTLWIIVGALAVIIVAAGAWMKWRQPAKITEIPEKLENEATMEAYVAEDGTEYSMPVLPAGEYVEIALITGETSWDMRELAQQGIVTTLTMQTDSTAILQTGEMQTDSLTFDAEHAYSSQGAELGYTWDGLILELTNDDGEMVFVPAGESAVQTVLTTTQAMEEET